MNYLSRLVKDTAVHFWLLTQFETLIAVTKTYDIAIDSISYLNSILKLFEACMLQGRWPCWQRRLYFFNDIEAVVGASKAAGRLRASTVLGECRVAA
ncbi:MAG: hypothetical protein ACI9PN_000287 [Candidatus Azotimanducaceae bacterium]